MATNFHDQLIAKAIASATKAEIPAVDPEDLKSLWNLETELEEITTPYKVEGQCRVFSLDTFGQVFKPDADIGSVYFRKAQLFFTTKFAELGKIEFPYIRNGKPDDAVFKAFATVPMKGLHKGMGQFPFDMEELIRIIQNEPEGYACNAFTISEDVKADLRISLAGSSPQRITDREDKC